MSQIPPLDLTIHSELSSILQGKNSQSLITENKRVTVEHLWRKPCWESLIRCLDSKAHIS